MPGLNFGTGLNGRRCQVESFSLPGQSDRGFPGQDPGPGNREPAPESRTPARGRAPPAYRSTAGVAGWDSACPGAGDGTGPAGEGWDRTLWGIISTTVPPGGPAVPPGLPGPCGTPDAFETGETDRETAAPDRLG
eukprot:767377-Hanusia_phi.AAC.3